MHCRSFVRLFVRSFNIYIVCTSFSNSIRNRARTHVVLVSCVTKTEVHVVLNSLFSLFLFLFSSLSYYHYNFLVDPFQKKQSTAEYFCSLKNPTYKPSEFLLNFFCCTYFFLHRAQIIHSILIP